MTASYEGTFSAHGHIWPCPSESGSVGVSRASLPVDTRRTRPLPGPRPGPEPRLKPGSSKCPRRPPAITQAQWHAMMPPAARLGCPLPTPAHCRPRSQRPERRQARAQLLRRPGIRQGSCARSTQPRARASPSPSLRLPVEEDDREGSRLGAANTSRMASPQRGPPDHAQAPGRQQRTLEARVPRKERRCEPWSRLLLK